MKTISRTLALPSILGLALLVGCELEEPGNGDAAEPAGPDEVAEAFEQAVEALSEDALLACMAEGSEDAARELSAEFEEIKREDGTVDARLDEFEQVEEGRLRVGWSIRVEMGDETDEDPMRPFYLVETEEDGWKVSFEEE